MINQVLGGWLLLSSFLWPHAPLQFRNSWSVGSLCVVIAALARSVPVLRFGNTALGLWLMCTTPITPVLQLATLWNNVVVGLAILVCSLFPGNSGDIGPRAAPV